MNLDDLSRRDFLKLSGASVAVSALGPLSGCLSNEKTALNLAYQPPALGQQAPYQVMKHKNYPSEYGYKLKTTKCSYGAEVVQNYLQGGIDIGQCGDFPGLTVLNKKPETTIIGNYIIGKQVLSLATKKGANFGLNDLKGKTIALPIGSTAEWFIREVLDDKTELNPENVDFMNAAPQNAVVSLSQGTADAAVLWHPWIERAQKDVGIDIISWGFGTDYYIVAPIFASNSYLENHEDTVQKYMNSRVRAMKYVHNNVDQVATWISNAESGQVEKKLAKRALNIVLGNPEEIDKEMGIKEVNAIKPWHSNFDSILQRAADFRRNKISKDFPEIDVSEFIEPKYTKKAIEKEAPQLFGDIEI